VVERLGLRPIALARHQHHHERLAHCAAADIQRRQAFGEELIVAGLINAQAHTVDSSTPIQRCRDQERLACKGRGLHLHGRDLHQLIAAETQLAAPFYRKRRSAEQRRWGRDLACARLIDKGLEGELITDDQRLA